MIEEKKIRRLEKKRSKVEKRLEKLKRIEALPKYLNAYRIKRAELDNEINRICAINLEQLSDDFKKIADNNYKNLEVNDLIFKPYQEQSSFIGNYAKYMKGKLRQNGHIYFETERVNNGIFNPFSEYLFASEYAGKIDCLGNVNVKASRLKGAFLNRLPSKLSCTISKYGSIKLKTIEREDDFITGGKFFISKIVGSYTFKNESLADQFFDNQQALLALIEEYRDQIIR